MNQKDNSILYSSPFVPAELITAYGFMPVRVPYSGGRASASTLSAGMCPVASAFIDAVRRDGKAAGYVTATSCDQMRRVGDYLDEKESKRVFTIGIPADQSSHAASDYFRNELIAFSKYLSVISGVKLTAKLLAKHLLVSNMGSPGGAAFLPTGRRQPCFARGSYAGLAADDHLLSGNPIRLAVIGGPLSLGKGWFTKTLSAAGAAVVLDGTEGGERTCPAKLDAGLVRKDPFGALTEAYFMTIPDVFFRPNDRLYDWVRRMVKQRKPDGVILVHQLWCDLWKAEEDRMRKETGLPLLALELADAGLAQESVKTRLQAFVESLARNRKNEMISGRVGIPADRGRRHAVPPN